MFELKMNMVIIKEEKIDYDVIGEKFKMGFSTRRFSFQKRKIVSD